ncbi:SHOCT domain-containing protein [Glycomyces salinus]|uniref:SHOCT domain-containing protein n=1 Tax=Glycomyces salinus TaxID=980294 RepID=UPI0018EC1A9C|nr:hypothetical protein [Glycomyces salinus]
MWHYYDGPGWGWAWGLLTFLFWAAIIGLIVWSVLRLSRATAAGGPVQATRPPFPQHAGAREILDRRYAAGEIDAAAYDEMRGRLEGSRTGDGSPPAAT